MLANGKDDQNSEPGFFFITLEKWHLWIFDLVDEFFQGWGVEVGVGWDFEPLLKTQRW